MPEVLLKNCEELRFFFFFSAFAWYEMDGMCKTSMYLCKDPWFLMVFSMSWGPHALLPSKLGLAEVKGGVAALGNLVQEQLQIK